MDFCSLGLPVTGNGTGVRARLREGPGIAPSDRGILPVHCGVMQVLAGYCFGVTEVLPARVATAVEEYHCTIRMRHQAPVAIYPLSPDQRQWHQPYTSMGDPGDGRSLTHPLPSFFGYQLPPGGQWEHGEAGQMHGLLLILQLLWSSRALQPPVWLDAK